MCDRTSADRLYKAYSRADIGVIRGGGSCAWRVGSLQTADRVCRGGRKRAADGLWESACRRRETSR